MEFLIWLILLIVGVLQVILFFKIWTMTDNVKAIKDKDGYDAYIVYAKTFAIAKAKEHLNSRPKVAEIIALYEDDTICSLSSEGGYDVKTVWSIYLKTESATVVRTCTVTLRITCCNGSLPMALESWKVISEPKAVL